MTTEETDETHTYVHLTFLARPPGPLRPMWQILMSDICATDPEKHSSDCTLRPHTFTRVKQNRKEKILRSPSVSLIGLKTEVALPRPMFHPSTTRHENKKLANQRTWRQGNTWTLAELIIHLKMFVHTQRHKWQLWVDSVEIISIYLTHTIVSCIICSIDIPLKSLWEEMTHIAVDELINTANLSAKWRQDFRL